MKNIIKKISFVLVLGFILIPTISRADSFSGYYDSYDGYYDNSYDSYDGYYDNSYDSYDGYYDNSYDSYDGYYDNSYDSYDGYYDNSYDSYDGYYDNSYDSYDGYYDNSYDSYDGYYDNSYDSYDGYYDNSYDSYDGYYDNSYDSYDGYYDNSYDSYDGYYDNYTYTPVTYGEYDYGYNSTYVDNSYVDNSYNDNSYNYTPVTYGEYDYGYNNNGGCNSNCGGTYYPPTCTVNCGGTPPIPPPPAIPPAYRTLDVICRVSDSSIYEGDSTTFTADVDGGSGSYTYRWSGAFSSTNKSVTQRFNNSGTYDATVRVTDSRGKTATANCDVVVREEYTTNNLDAVCRVSDTTIDEGDRVTFTADVTGGRSSYTYDWSGDVNENDKSFSTRFNQSGRYTINLKVTDRDGNISRDTCYVRVDDVNNDKDRNVYVTSNTYSTGGGNSTPPLVGSVYLNQVPYTGPEDVAKGIAFVALLLGWSTAGAVILRKKLNKDKTSKRIQDFKDANKLANI